jgi:hypothetical protein
MANFILCGQNHVDSEFYKVVFSRGAWSLPLTNLATPSLEYEVARSASVSLADTVFEVDLGGVRDIRAAVLPRHTMSKAGLHRRRYSSVPKWSGVSTSGTNSSGASSLTVSVVADTNFSSGDTFWIEGSETVYECASNISVLAGGTTTISIIPNLSATVTSGKEVNCSVGDFTSPTYDSGWLEVFPTIYESLEPYWGHPSFWDGKPTDEDIATNFYPIIGTHSELQFARYIKWEFDDSTNPRGYFDIPRLFISAAWQPTFNIEWGASVGFFTDTEIRKTLNSREVATKKPVGRIMRVSLSNLPKSEVYSNIYNTILQQGITGQVFVIFDPDEVEGLHQRAFLATMSELTSISSDYFGGGLPTAYEATSLGFLFKEVVA